MHSSHPSDPKAPKGAWKSVEGSAEDLGEDRLPLDIEGGVDDSIMPEGDGDEGDRETAPPPLPVAEYVQTMMKQADTDDAPGSEPPASRAPLSYRGEPPSSRAPLSYRGEPPSSRAPLSYRGEPPAPRSRPKVPPDATPIIGSLRAADLAEFVAERNAGQSPRWPLSRDAVPSSVASRAPREDAEFERRPRSLRGAEPPLKPTEPEPWTTGGEAPLSDPHVRADKREGDALLSSRKATLRAPTQRQNPRGSSASPHRMMTPAASSKPSFNPSRKPNAFAVPAASPGRPLPPPPVPKGPPPNAKQATVSKGNVGGLRRKTTLQGFPRPPSDSAADAEIDALPFDDLVEAAHRSAPPPPLPPAPPMVPAKAPVPAGLRLGKEPLSSFSSAIEAPDEEEDRSSIPMILDVAWAGSASFDEGTEGHRAALPKEGAASSKPPVQSFRSPPSTNEDDAIPAILDVGWAFAAGDGGLRDESVAVTPEGAFEDDLQPIDEIQARFDEGDFSGTLLLAEQILAHDPLDERARRFFERARERLIEDYETEFGGRQQIPVVIMPPEEVRFLSLDHRSGFLLSCIDGRMSIEEVLDVSTMPEVDALRILFDLRQQGVIALDPSEPRSTRR
jgi:hypothetical protein